MAALTTWFSHAFFNFIKCNKFHGTHRERNVTLKVIYYCGKVFIVKHCIQHNQVTQSRYKLRNACRYFQLSEIFIAQ